MSSDFPLPGIPRKSVSRSPGRGQRSFGEAGGSAGTPGRGIPSAPRSGPLRLSDIKYAVYGHAGFGPGVHFDRVLLAGWDLHPSIGLVASDMHRLGLDLHSFREPLTRSIRLVMMPSIAKNFDEEGRPEKWEELAQYTVQVRGDAHPILTRTGALKRAASSFTIWSVGSASATIRSLPPHVWYGYLHQEGYGSIRVKALRMLGGHGTEKEIAKVSNYIAQQAEKKRGASKFAIPQREFILFQREDIEMVQEVFIEWMEAQADKVGRGWAGR